MAPINKILLINPPIQDFYQTEIRQQPLGLKSIQAVLQREGYQSYLLDCLASNKKHTIPIPRHFNYLKRYYHTNDLSPFKLFTHYRHFGLAFDDIAKQIKIFKPDLIGISVNFTPYFDVALETARLCKLLFPDIPIVAGGHHATAVPEDILKTGLFDFVILGEGELRVLKLIEYLSQHKWEKIQNLDGIAYKNKDKILINPVQEYIQNLDDLPIQKIKNDIGMLITSRGCPRKCNFCSIANVMGKKVRFRSADSILEEIESGIKNGVRQFDFEDDHFTINRARVKKILNKIIKRFDKYHLTLSAMNGIMADTLDEELVQLMKSAGFEWLNLPLVSGNPHVQKKIQRNQSYQHFSNVIAWAQKYSLKIVAYLIIGLPEDKMEQMINDIIFLAGQPVLIGPSIFYPPPGSATFTKCVQNGYITGKDYVLYRSSAFPVETENFSRQDLVTLFRLVRAVNIIKRLTDQYLDEDQNLFTFLKNHQIERASLIFERKLTPDEIGILLLNLLFLNKKLKGLSLKTGTSNKFQYECIEYNISEDLIEQFLSKLKGKVIRGVSKMKHILT